MEQWQMSKPKFQMNVKIQMLNKLQISKQNFLIFELWI